MKALLKLAKGEGNVALKEMPEPTPGKGEAVIRVQVAGVCGTDVHIYYDRFPNSPPVILGHEFSGIIEQLDPDVKTLQVGERVVSENNPFACGACRICSLGYPNLCSQKKAMGIHSNGCFSEYIKLPANLLHRIPDNISFEEAALTEPLAVSIHALSQQCRIEPGDTVLVFGPGAIGLLGAQVAMAEGAGSVILVGTTKDEKVRFNCAEKLGIETLNIEKENPEKKIMDLTGKEEVDVVMEASGSEAAIIQGIKLLRKKGRMAIVGITGHKKISLDWDLMVSRGLSLFFSYSSRNFDWEKALKLLSERKVTTLPLITHRFPIKEWKKAFGVLETLQAIRPILLIGQAK